MPFSVSSVVRWSPAVSTKSPLGLRQWIWRAFVQSALVPLVLVETALIAIYLLTNNAIRDAQIEHLRETALTDLKVAANLESRVIDEQLGQISALTELYRNLTARALEQEPPAQRPGLALSADFGIYRWRGSSADGEGKVPRNPQRVRGEALIECEPSPGDRPLPGEELLPWNCSI